MEETARPSSTEEEVTFNVVYTRGTAAWLLPNSLSFLQSAGARVRLVANGCDRAEVELLRAVAASDERLSFHLLPYPRPVAHGVALNDLFVAYPEPRFAFADSDVLASGDFIAALARRVPRQAGAFSANSAWMFERESAGTRGPWVLTGGTRTLDDGTYIGNTYCAIYEREAVAPHWRASPNGFASVYGYQLSRAQRAALASRGWRWRMYDTARVINLWLLMAGFRLERRDVPELHHFGGFSVVDLFAKRTMIRRVAAVLRSSPEGRLRQFMESALMRLYMQIQQIHGDPERPQRIRRRDAVLAHLDLALEAIIADEPLPPPLKTDWAEVDERVAALVAALETEYPRGLALIDRATEAPLAEARA